MFSQSRDYTKRQLNKRTTYFAYVQIMIIWMGTNFRQFVRRWSEGEKDKREEAEGFKEIKGGREKGGKEEEKEVESTKLKSK